MVSARSLGEVAISAFKSSQAEENKKAVAAILSAVEAKSAPCSDADTEARIDSEFAAVMGEIEATGRMSGRDKDVDPQGPGVANVEADPGAHGLEASGVKPYVTNRRSDGPPSAGQGSALPTVDCGEATQHNPIVHRTWEDVHADLLLAHTRKGARRPIDAANVGVVRRVLHTNTGLCVLPGLDPPQNVSLLTEADGQNGEVPVRMHWFNLVDLTTALALCGVNVGSEVVVLEELPMTTQEWSAMIHGDGSAVCRYANRPQWGSIAEDLKGVYRRLHETAMSRAAAARVEMEDPNSSVVCVIGKDLLHWAVLIRPGVTAGTSILGRMGCDLTSDESRAFRSLGFVGTCADVCRQGDCGPHCVAVALALLRRPLFAGHDDRRGAAHWQDALPATPTLACGTHQSPDLGRRSSGQAGNVSAHHAEGDTVFRFGMYKGQTWRALQSGRCGPRGSRWVEWARAQPNPSRGLKDFVTWLNASDNKGMGSAIGVGISAGSSSPPIVPQGTLTTPVGNVGRHPGRASEPLTTPSGALAGLRAMLMEPSTLDVICAMPVTKGYESVNGCSPPLLPTERMDHCAIVPSQPAGHLVQEEVHRPFWREYDLSVHLEEKRGPTLPVGTAQAFYRTDFQHAVELLGPVIRAATGTDFFSKMTKPRACPLGWFANSQNWPPCTRGEVSVAYDRFGVQYRCDYQRNSGCPVTLKIMREHGRHPVAAVYSLQISTEPHRHACNHIIAKGTRKYDSELRYPAIHPVVDAFLRSEARADHNITPRQAVPRLVHHLKSTTHLHCRRCHASVNQEGDYEGHQRKESPLCFQQFVHRDQAKLSGHAMSAQLPGVVDTSAGKKTEDRYVTVHHMVVEDGHAASGSGAMPELQRKQVQEKLRQYKKAFGGDAVLDKSMPADGSMEEHFRVLEQENLFLHWDRCVRENNLKAFDIYEWRMVALLYTNTKPESVKARRCSGVARRRHHVE